MAKSVPATKSEKGTEPKTICPISRADFLAKAPPIEVIVAGHKFIAGARRFSTGSVGYNLGEKFTEIIDGKVITFQVGLNVIVVGSKEMMYHTSTE